MVTMTRTGKEVFITDTRVGGEEIEKRTDEIKASARQLLSSLHPGHKEEHAL